MTVAAAFLAATAVAALSTATAGASVACSCSPRSYSFRILLDRDCAASSLPAAAEAHGLSNADCRISGEGASGAALRDAGGRRAERDGGGGSDDLWSALPASLRQPAAPVAPGAPPASVSSAYFFEFDTSGELTIINEDDAYFNVTIRNGTVLSYDSISRRLDPSLPLEDQRERVPGGAGLFLFDAAGAAVASGRFVWEFAACDGTAPRLAGETLGWIEFAGITPALHEFCPASSTPTPPSSSPTAAAPTPMATPAPIASPVVPATGAPTPRPTRPSQHGTSSKGSKASKGSSGRSAAKASKPSQGYHLFSKASKSQGHVPPRADASLSKASKSGRTLSKAWDAKGKGR